MYVYIYMCIDRKIQESRKTEGQKDRQVDIDRQLDSQISRQLDTIWKVDTTDPIDDQIDKIEIKQIFHG